MRSAAFIGSGGVGPPLRDFTSSISQFSTFAMPLLNWWGDWRVMVKEHFLGTTYSLTQLYPPLPNPARGLLSASLQSATLRSGSTRQTCRIQAIASGGAALRLVEPFDVSATMRLELECGEELASHLVWYDARSAAVRFQTPVDVLRLLRRHVLPGSYERRQFARIQINSRARIESNSGVAWVAIHDISPAGLKVESEMSLAIGNRVRIACDGLLPLSGAVCWAEGAFIGIALSPELSWRELLPWLSDLSPMSSVRHCAGSTLAAGARIIQRWRQEHLEPLCELMLHHLDHRLLAIRDAGSSGSGCASAEIEAMLGQWDSGRVQDEADCRARLAGLLDDRELALIEPDLQRLIAAAMAAARRDLIARATEALREACHS